jgi:hypothetical protein
VTADPFTGLLWPWNATADAVRRWDDARQRHHAAQTAGDMATAEAAAFDQQQAEADFHQVRERCAELSFDEISGTLGVNGAADGLMVLDRQRGANAAALFLTGRDLADQTVSLSWSPDAGLWSVAGRVHGIERPERVDVGNKVERCVRWLRGILEMYSWPDADLLAGAEVMGFTFDNVKEAKARLRKADPPLNSRPRSKGGEWWCWVGEKADMRPDRPEAARRELLRTETPHTPQTWPDERNPP